MGKFCSLVVALVFCVGSAWAVQQKGNARELYKSGVECNKQGKLKDAISYYTQAIALKPKSAELYFVRGRAYRQNDQLRESADDLTRAVTLKPGYAEAYNQRGIANVGLSKKQEALADFKKACDLGYQDGCRNVGKFKELNGR